MKQTLTQAEVEHYREHGYVVIDEFLDASELAAWRETITTAVAERGNEWIPGVAQQPDPDRLKDPETKAFWEHYLTIYKQRVNLWKTHSVVRDLIDTSSMPTFASQVFGRPDVRLYSDQAFFKQPYGNATSFHLDVPYWSFTSPHSLTIWVALDDATVENGCLHFVPDTHKAEKYDNVTIGPAIGDLFNVYPEWAKIPAVTGQIPAGGCTIHNGLTAHGAGPNMTPFERRAMSFQFVAADVTFNGLRNVLPPEYQDTLAIGDPLDNDEHLPLYIR